MNRIEFIKSSIFGLTILQTVDFSGFPKIQKLTFYGDGIHDDSDALQAWFDGKEVFDISGKKLGCFIYDRNILTSKTINLNKARKKLLNGCRISSTAFIVFKHNGKSNADFLITACLVKSINNSKSYQNSICGNNFLISNWSVSKIDSNSNYYEKVRFT